MQKFICFSLTRAILYSCNLLCYNEGSGHVLMWGMISKNNYESAILCKCIWELWRHARRSYFRRFHWIMSHSSSTQVGFPHPSTVPCEHGPKCCCRAVYCPWMDFNNNRRTSPDGCIPIILSLRTGLFYKARGFAWANFVHMRQPTPPPNDVLLASIVLLCFIEYTLKADTPDIWPKLNFCSHRRWAFLPYFLTSIQTPYLWYYWCTRQYGHVRAVFDSILNTFFFEFVQAQDLMGFVALGPRTPIFKNWV